MNLNRKILSAAVSSLLLSNSAFAVIGADFSVDTDVSNTYAKETSLQSAVKFTDNTTVADGKLNIKYVIGNVPAVGQLFYIRYELSAGASWDTTDKPSVVISDASGADQAGVTEADISYEDSDGNTATKEVMVVSLKSGTTASTTDVTTGYFVEVGANNTVGAVDANSPTINISSNAADIKVSISTYETSLSNALSGAITNRLLAPISKTYMKFAVDTVLLTNPSSSDAIINTSDGGKAFTVTDNSAGVAVDKAALCSFDIDFNQNLSSTSTVLSVTGGTSAAISTAITSGTTLNFTGNFSAAKTSGVFLSGDDDCSTSDVVGTVAAGSQSVAFTPGNNSMNSFATTGSGDRYLCLTVDGNTAIPASSYEGVYTPKAAAGFIVEPLAISCSKVSNGGSTASVPLLLKGEAAWKNFVRITNPSNVAGKIFIKAFNDDGIAGATTMEFILGAGESTGVIPSSEIITATGVDLTIADNVVGVTGGLKRNKARLEVTAAFGKNGEASAVKVRTYSLASDNTSFSEFQ